MDWRQEIITDRCDGPSQWSSNLNGHQNHLEAYLKTHFSGFHPRVSDVRSLGLGSEKFAFLTSSRDADTAGQETTL